MKKISITIFAIILLPALIFAQGFDWLPGSTYDRSIPTPESVLGFEIGTYLTDHLQMVDYIRKLAESTDKVQIVKFGQSIERRDLYLVIISSPENMSRLEDIRLAIERLTDPRAISESEAAEIARTTPAIGWMNYANDGNESAAFETGIQLAYQLAAGSDPVTNKINREVITILNMALNPDSHQRYVTWMKAVTVGKYGTADPAASEHRGDWLMATNNNHYDIDLNRDAFAQSQLETRESTKVMHHWNPQIWVDNHGDPDEYFFAPFVSPINLNYPSSLLKWATEIGLNNARYFDKYGWTFKKDETYDIYYPGYWDSYPAFYGAIGMTYETDGGGRKAFRYEIPDKTIKTLRDGIHHHFTTNVATLEVLADNREAILNDFFAFRKTGMDEAKDEQFKTYILVPGRDNGRLIELVNLFLLHQFEIYKTSSEITVGSSQTYHDRSAKTRLIPSGSYLIPLNQPQKRMIKTLLEPDPKMEDLFLGRVEEIRNRNKKLGSSAPKERTGFYDVTAWALPLTYGVEAVFTGEALSVSGSRRITENLQSEGKVDGGRAGYAYLFSYETDAGAKLAGRLLQEDYRVALATKTFRNSGRDFPQGTLVVRTQRNPETLHNRISGLAEEYGTEVFAVNTAWGETGISLGSGSVRNLEKPRIMVLTNAPASPTAYGAIWYMLEKRYELEFSAVRAEHFAAADLSRYNVIIFPDGSASGYQTTLGETGVENLKAWVRSGGTFIGIKGGAVFANRSGVEMTDVKLITEVPDSDPEPMTENEDESPMKPVENIPGSIFKARVNNDYYLGLGYPEEIAVQVRGSYLFPGTKTGANVVTFPENSFIMGHKWEDSEEVLTGKMYLADVPLGSGHVILFADDPTFRLYWRGLDRLLLSSILFAPAF